jgi:signal transduction histidine kinase
MRSRAPGLLTSSLTVCALVGVGVAVTTSAEPPSPDHLSWTVAYYASVITLLLIFGGLTLVVRQYIWTLYAGLGLAVITWPPLHEQSVTQVFSATLVVSRATVIGYGFFICATMFTVAAIATERRHRFARYRPILWGLALASLTFLVISPLFAPSTERAILLFFQIVGMICHVIPVTTFTQIDGEDDLFAAGCGVILAVAFLLHIVLTASGIAPTGPHHFIMDRYVILCAVLFGTLLSMRHILAVQRSREDAFERALAAAERDAAQSRALLDAERNYAEARNVARRRQEQLATTSHDIMQPLMSLRSTVDSITAERDPALQAEMREAFGYLEKVATGYREQETDVEAPPSGTETIPISVLMDTLDRMFRAEAETKGLAFNAEPIAAEVTVDPLAVMRVLSNLTSNAIKHSDSGTVTIRAHRQDGSVDLDVANTGPALNKETVARFMQPNEKGQGSTGSGLGLAIAKELSEKAGLGLSHRYDETLGNVFSVQLEVT